MHRKLPDASWNSPKYLVHILGLKEDGDWCPWTYDSTVLFAYGVLNLTSPTSIGGSGHICDQSNRAEPIKMVSVADGHRYLGVQSSPRLDTGVSKKLVDEIVDELLERVKSVPVGGDETRFLLEQVLRQR